VGKRRRLFVLGGLAVAALAAIPALRRLVPEDNRIQWSGMVWASAMVSGRAVQHAALMAETDLEGSRKRGLMQLDLGIYQSVFYSPASGALNGASVSGTIAKRRFRNERFPSYPRLAVLGENAILPQALDRGVEYLPMSFQLGHVLVAATIDGQEAPNAIFDTGSSMIPLLTSRKRWLEWTHRQPEDPLNSTLRGNSWGQEAVLTGAPVGTLCIGAACLSHPEIYFEPSPASNRDLDKCPRLSGLFGNAIFDGRYTVIVDIPDRRLGLIHGSFAASGE
jgi:hypothetical protein